MAFRHAHFNIAAALESSHAAMTSKADDSSTPIAVLSDKNTSDTPAEPVNSSQSKKRGHEATTDELEIDLSLPEPPSKKAARKAKKQKPARSETSDKLALPEAPKPNHHLTASHTSPPSAIDDAKPKPEKRSAHAIWIGNLPYHATTHSLRTFITTHAPSIRDAQITRIHMPAPTAPSHRMYRNGQRPTSKGFAYVDFDSAEALDAALALTETEFEPGGRKVLVKNALSFEGRPDGDGAAGEARGGKAGTGDKESAVKPRSRRVFVGNLAFDVTKEDLEAHYAQCGEVLDVHMATFEDTGKCKGFAWVSFADESAAEAAVKGFVMKSQDVGGEEDDGNTEKPAKPRKPRKWFVNKLHGRELRVEFAEDASYRYKKRFGSEAKSKNKNDQETDNDGNPAESESLSNSQSANDRRRVMRKAAKGAMRSIRLALSESDSGKAAGALPVAQGTKITFD